MNQSIADLAKLNAGRGAPEFVSKVWLKRLKCTEINKLHTVYRV